MRCSFPQAKVEKDGSVKYFACGNCRACRRNKQLEWGFRAYVESLYYSSNCFVTLTYDDEHLPKNSSLVKTEIADFLKRLRNYVGFDKVRYFGSGEYGELNHRPHYHIIIYGLSLDNPVFYNLFYSKKKKGYWCFCKAWRDLKGNPRGEVFIGEVTLGSCQYCAKYIMKKKTGRSGKRYYERYKIQPEFCAMSRMPGLGFRYLSDNFNLIKNRGYVMLKGHKIKLPRYYIDKLFLDGTDEREEYKELKQAKFVQSYNDFFKNRDIGQFTEHSYMKKYLEQQELNLQKEEMFKK